MFLDFTTYNPIRRLSGITATSASIASLAKSTPSISTDLKNERPMSFTVLPNNSSLDTYQSNIDPYKSTLSCSSLASFTWTPFLETTTTAVPQPSSTISSMLRNSFGDHPDAIRPIVSTLEYSNITTASAMKVPTYKIPSSPLKSPIISDVFNRNATLERYNKFVEKQKLQLELKQQQQQADFLSLSLSPPMNRRNKEMLALRGSFVSL